MIFLSLLIFSCSQSIAQSCSIMGTIVDKTTSEPIPFAKVTLSDSSGIKGTSTTDFDGLYKITNLHPGVYTLKVIYLDFNEYIVTHVILSSDSIITMNASLERKQFELQECTIVAYKIERKDLAKMSISGSRSKIPSCRVMNTESYSKIDDNSFKTVKENPLSTFSIDVDRASYSNIRRFINQGSLPPADAVRVEEMINYFTYQYPQPVGKDPFSITTEYTDCPWNKEHKLVHIGFQGKEISMTQASANNLTFLIDVSGSMESADKLDLVKAGLYLLVDQLREQDKVAIVVYAGAAGLVLPPTSGADKEQIKSVIENLTAGGSTAGGAGITLAYKIAKENFITEGNNRVILATDGDFNVGISSEGDLIRLIEEKRKDNIFLTVLGFGTGNYQDSKMEQLADKGNGNYAYVDNILEAKKVFVSELGGTLITIAKDVKIQTEFNPKYVKEYRLVGYENRMLDDEDFNDDKKDAGEIGSGHTVTAIYEIIPANSKEKRSNIDPLKYQNELSVKETGEFQNEVLTIKVRYKNPNEINSNLIKNVVYDIQKPFNETSDNCKFAVSVAEFGMLLRNSEFKGNSNFKDIIELAKNAKGKDNEGYRAEFIRLVESAELIR